MDDLPPEDLGSPRNLERLESGNSPMMTLTLSAALPELVPEIAKADADPAPCRPSENLAEDGLPTRSATWMTTSCWPRLLQAPRTLFWRLPAATAIRSPTMFTACLMIMIARWIWPRRLSFGFG